MSFDNTFNPYFDICPVYDTRGAAKLRRDNLRAMLEGAASVKVDTLWVGRDLGYRGGRRTGLALTDDIYFFDHLKRWGIESKKRPTKGELVAERTAAVIWNILEQIDNNIFMWNVFPLHTFNEGDCFSNRSHNAKEREAGVALLLQIIDYIRPNKIIAIGNDAFKVLSKRAPSENVFKVRHPSYGGQSEFLATMRELYL